MLDCQPGNLQCYTSVYFPTPAILASVQPSLNRSSGDSITFRTSWLSRSHVQLFCLQSSTYSWFPSRPSGSSPACFSALIGRRSRRCAGISISLIFFLFSINSVLLSLLTSFTISGLGFASDADEPPDRPNRWCILISAGVMVTPMSRATSMNTVFVFSPRS